MDNRPKLRPVEAFSAICEGRKVIALRDPQGYAEGMYFVSHEALPLLSLFDGRRTLMDICGKLAEETGQLVSAEDVQSLIDQLDSCHLLESPAFADYKQEVINDFRLLEVRKPYHAGSAYEEYPPSLKKQLDNLFLTDGAPGLPDSANINGPIRGLVVPHIDFQRGGPTYAHAYKALAESEPADLYVILGVAHAGSENPVVMTKKSFETPLGTLETNTDFVEEVSRHCDLDLFSDEIAHKAEHSIEFQTLFLKHLITPRANFEIVPILMGSFHEWILRGREPIESEEIRSFIDALRTTIERFSTEKKVCLIASIDLSHVGYRFGDSDRLTNEFLTETQEKDRSFLEHLLRKDASALFKVISEEKDQRKICGFPALYVFCHLLSNSEGKLLDYRQWADPSTGCSVSFAGAVFR